MTAADPLACRIDDRRRAMFGNDHWNGLDYLDVADDQRSLCVHFFGAIPQGLTPRNVRVRGGRRIRDIAVVDVRMDPSRDAELDDCLKVTLDRAGDFSTYTLYLVDVPGIDPRYACLDFAFKTGCPSDLDCGAALPCPPAPRVEPAISYLAKDYASFRQLVLDRLALIMPDWRERHAADPTVTLVEILAYLGDHLSYYQDAVATEAYLDTARQRISIRRHLRLIDYRLHEGCNARAFVTVGIDADVTLPAADLWFETDGDALTFEPMVRDETLSLRAAHGRIRFHDWGDRDCCLPAGTTRATLLDTADQPDPDAPRSLHLAPGDWLILEEVRGAITGAPGDADPAHRHVVRLTAVTPGHDALLSALVLEVEWAAADALSFALCLSAHRPAPDCDAIADVAVARGNVVLVDHGRTVTQPLGPVGGRDIPGDCACEGSAIETRREALRFAPTLDRTPLVFAAPLTVDAPAAAILAQDAREALPALTLDDWRPRADLLSSGPDDRDFVVEIDDERIAYLRFGDGIHARRPDADAGFTARYRIGGGTAGNVGREAITRLVLRDGTIDGTITVRNPIAATGGTDAEPTSQARMLAPGTIAARRERAIVAQDYADLAERDPQIQGAAATMRWTGSWLEARVAIDPAGTEDVAPALIHDVTGALHRYRRIGHDLSVAPGRYVPLRLVLEVCILPDAACAQVKAALLDTLHRLFAPDRWRFGQGVATSRIVAAAMAVAGIQTVRVAALTRLDEAADTTPLDTGLLAIGAGEIARLDDDPDFPENGTLGVIWGGGR